MANTLIRIVSAYFYENWTYLTPPLHNRSSLLQRLTVNIHRKFGEETVTFASASDGSIVNTLAGYVTTSLLTVSAMDTDRAGDYECTVDSLTSSAVTVSLTGEHLRTVRCENGPLRERSVVRSVRCENGPLRERSVVRSVRCENGPLCHNGMGEITNPFSFHFNFVQS